MTNDEQQELLDLIAGRGKWAWTGKAGFHTHPSASKNQDALHSACLELEQNGLIRRLIDEPGNVCWVEAKEPPR